MKTTYLTGLIGAGIGASLSPPLHHSEAARHGLRMLYHVIDLEETGGGLDGPDEPDGPGGRDGAREVGRLLSAARTVGFDGLNITHPCKQAVIEYLDALDPEAAALGAVNTVMLRDGRAIGYNTDSIGFARGFVRGLPDAPTRTVVQLGAGGAGSAVAHALLGGLIGVDRLVVIDKRAERGEALAAALCARFGARRAESGTLDDLAGYLAAADGLVNTSPVGMAANPGLPLPAEQLRPGLWVGEIVYLPLETELLRVARDLGCRTIDGGNMLVYQAAEAFRLFTDREPDVEAMFEDYHRLAAVRTAAPEPR